MSNRVSRWLFNGGGAQSPENARRNALFVSAAAGLYVFLIAGGLPPRDWLGWVQVTVALLLVLAAMNSWRGYRTTAESAQPPPNQPPDQPEEARD